MNTLKCDGCRKVGGVFYSYEEWEDFARDNDWLIGEEFILCPECRGIPLK